MFARAGAAFLITLSIGVTPAWAQNLSPGEHTFWDGPYTESAFVPSSQLCDIAGPCWTHRLG